MPTEPTVGQHATDSLSWRGWTLLAVGRRLLRQNNIESALHTLSGRTLATFELYNTGGLIRRFGPDPADYGETRCESRFVGDLWSGIFWAAKRDESLVELWLLVMEQFDHRTVEAWTDPLTGLGNRRWLEFELTSRPPVLVGFFDVIGLQATNREHGHSAGDERLRAAAEALAKLAGHAITIPAPFTNEATRSGRAFRVGGDEFVVLLAEAPATTPAIPDGLRGGWGSDLAEAQRQMRDS